MPQKSQYIQAPLTRAKLKKGIVDAFAFAGADTTITTDAERRVFDTDYWIAKRTTSTTNLVPESEQLIQPGFDYIAYDTKANGNGFGMGAEIYVSENTDVGLPFKLINNMVPRTYENDMYQTYHATGLAIGTVYTFSFWARKPAGQPAGNKLWVRVANSGLTVTAYSQFLDITDTFTRYSATFTANASQMQIVFGGNYSWRGVLRTKHSPSLSYIFNTQNPSLGTSVLTQLNATNAPTDLVNAYNTIPDAEYDDALNVTFTGANGYVRSSRTFTNNAAFHGVQMTFSVYVKSTAPVSFVLDTNSGWAALNAASGMVHLNSVLNNGTWELITATINVPANTSLYYWQIHNRSGGANTASFTGFNIEMGGTRTGYEPRIPLDDADYGDTTFRVMTGNITNAYIGELDFSGLQLNVGATATAYSPVRNWVYFKEDTDTVVDTEFIGEVGKTFYFNNPSGITRSFINVIKSEAKVTFGIQDMIRRMEPDTTDFGYTEITQGTSEGGSGGGSYAYYKVMGIGTSSSTSVDSSYLTSSQRWAGIYGWQAYPSNTVRKPQITNDVVSLKTVGNAYSTLQNYMGVGQHTNGGLDRAGVINSKATKVNLNSRLKITYNGTVGRLNTDNEMCLGFHIKTAGNGRRKFVHILVKETVNEFYLQPFTELYQANARTGMAEIEGFMKPTHTHNFFVAKDLTDSTARRFKLINLLPIYSYPNLRVPKNSDTFVFMQGAADGFTFSVTSGNGFKLLYSVADLVNNPFIADNGNLFTRYATSNFERLDNYTPFKWYAHSDTVFPFYKTTNSTTHSGFYSGEDEIFPGQDYAEIYGEDTTALNRELIYPMFIYAVDNNNAVNRGQLKNFFYSKAALMEGAVGDILIAQDNSRYFTLSKTIYATAYVKV